MSTLWERLPEHTLLGVSVFGLVLLMIFIARRYEAKQVSPAMVASASGLVQRAADHAYAAQQIQDPVLALTRANYARAYFNVARSLVPESELQFKTGLAELNEDIEREELASRERLLQRCPQAGGKTRLAKNAGWAPTTEAQSLQGAQAPQPSTQVPSTQFTALPN